jgi:hypothetical protein
MCPAASAGEELEMVMVTKNFNTRLLDPGDLSSFTQLRPRTLSQKLTFPFHQPAALLRAFLRELFENIEETTGAAEAKHASVPPSPQDEGAAAEEGQGQEGGKGEDKAAQEQAHAHDHDHGEPPSDPSTTRFLINEARHPTVVE